MSDDLDKLRSTVARRLRLRQLRWRFFAGSVVVEAGILLALARHPSMLILLPAFAGLTLLPFMFVGRSRLPREECDSNANFASQAALLASCHATHDYRPPGRWKKVRVGIELKSTLRRRFRGLRSPVKFAVVRDAENFLILTARSYWLCYARSLRFGDIGTIGIDLTEWTEDVQVTRADDDIVGRTWRHATKTGERDRRYKRNFSIWEVRRHGVDLTFGDIEWPIELYAYGSACMFANALSAICGQGPALVETEEQEDAPDPSETQEHEAEEVDADEDELPGREWHDVLGTPSDASSDVIRAAYRERLKEYHPDRVAHLGKRLRDLADEEALAINQAYSEAMRQRT